MLKKILSLTLIAVLAMCMLTACGSKKDNEPVLEDGVYTAKFTTDSNMFHVNDEYDDTCFLYVTDGQMVIHVTLNGKGILNLFPGTAEDAQKDGAVWLQPTEDTVNYSDGTTDTAYGFDIPVPYLDQEFDCALVGKKGTWYDHKVMVTNVEKYVNTAPEVKTIEVTLTGGSGRASIQSPCEIVLEKDGTYTAVIVWSSPNYDYMIVNGTEYLPVQTEGNSTFRIPVVLDTEMAVSADTVAMGTPHLIDYTLFFDSSTMK